jgi:Domain of unknown function (DUF4386)
MSIGARLAAASGAFYVISVIIGSTLMGSTVNIAARGAYALVLLGFTAFVVFVGFLHRVLRSAEGPNGWLGTVALGAGLLHSAVRFQAQAPRMVGQFRGDTLPPDLAGVLVDLNDMAFITTGLLLGLYCASAGAVCVNHRVLPRWLGWFGLISGVSAIVTGVIGMADPQKYLAVPFLAGLAWTMIVSIVLTARPRSLPTQVDQVPAARPASVAVAE